MPAPSTFPDWDTNATNTVALVSGHVSDGFINNEVPTAGELNEWMMLVGLWIRYHNQRDSRVMPLIPANGQVISDGGGTHTAWFNTAGSFYAQIISDTLLLPIRLEPGAHITQVNGIAADGSAGVFLWDMELWKRDISGNNSPVQIGTTQTTSGVSGIGAVNLTIGSLNETIAANTVYYFLFHPHSGTTGGYNTYPVYGAQVTYDIPAV